MSFVLSVQCNDDVVAAFRRYREYLESVRQRFPPSAFALTTSDWYYNFTEPRCPHDGRLEYVRINELSPSKRHEPRTVSLTTRLFGAYHDGYIEFHYPTVFSYKLELSEGSRGHCDWLRDEFRLADSGRLIYEIEWCRTEETGHWLIEASDVQFRWLDLQSK